MPRYVVSSEGPIHVKEIHRPDDLEGEAGQLPVFPERPSWPPDFELPTLPPRDQWPPLPPWFQPGVGLPIPPTVELPWVPIPEGPEIEPPSVWPPLPGMPGLPDLSGKTLILARFYVSRHVNYLRWVVIDHAETKTKLERAIQWIKDHLPAGGIVGRPPNTSRPEPR